MRTGTSVLQSVLCASPDAHPMIAECQYLTAQLQLYARWRDRFDVFLRDYFNTEEEFFTFTKNMVEGFLDTARQRLRPRSALVLKNPELTFFFPELADLLPHARFVVSVRDPKDAIASIIEVGKRLRERGLQQMVVEMGRDVPKLCNHLKSYYAPLVQATQRPGLNLRERLLYVRYENLIANPVETIDRLAAFCGVSLDDFDANAAWNTAIDFNAMHNDAALGAWSTALYGKGLSDESIGRHREVLTDGECAEVDRLCGDYNRMFGYTVA